MRQVSLFIGLLGIIALSLVAAPTQAQFAGCITEADEPYAMSFIVEDIYDSLLTVTVFGVDGFDPQIELRRTDTNELLDCNNNTRQTQVMGFELPTAQGGYSVNSAQTTIRFYADENPDDEPTDFEIIISSADGTSGEFVLLYQGAAIWDATDIDQFTITATEAQVEANAPLFLYVSNLDRETINLDPQLTFPLGTDFSVTCQYSSVTDLCGPNTVPLDGFNLTLDLMETYEMTGYDAMLNIPLDIPNTPFTFDVRSIESLTWGDYVLVVHSAIIYPE